MKIPISVAVISVFCAYQSPSAAEETTAERLTILAPNGGTQFTDRPLDVTWSHPSSYAGKKVFAAITLMPKADVGTARGSHYLVLSEKISVALAARPTERRTLIIPVTVPLGEYTLAIVEVPESDFAAISSDKSDEVIRITRPPKIQLTASAFASEFTIGDSPEFPFSLEGPDRYGIEAFLLKDGGVGGVVWWSTNETERATSLRWQWTRYYSESGPHFPKTGTGYRVLIGVLKDLTQSSYIPGVGLRLDAFESYDVTPTFRITGTLPRVLTEPTGAEREFYIWVIGEPGSPFVLARSPVVPTPFAVELLRDTIPRDGVWERLLTRGDTVDLFVFAIPTGTLER